MKKVLAFVSLLVLAAACGEPATNKQTASNANANMTAETKTPARMTDDEAIAKEKAVWEAIKNKDYEGFGNMLASDQMYVSSDGVYDKAGSINGIKGFEPTELAFSDWKVIPIDKDTFVVSYTVSVKGNSNGKPMPPETIRGSSAWVNRDGKWLSIYHQDTPVKAAPPSPPPSPSPAKSSQPAKSQATPAAKTAEASTGADPAANEKMVWDAIKRMDYDAFAAFLASDAIEVEPEAVYDKAGSVKNVSQVDLSKAGLSDWKVVNLNNNAALVTYMVKLPGANPDQERHSTIWVNRGGKWMALFHQGTPVAKPAAAKAATPAAAASPTPKKMKMKM